MEQFTRPDDKGVASPIDYILAFSVVAVAMLGPVMLILMRMNGA